MRQSAFFTKTSKNTSGDDVSINAQYLTRGGFITKLMAGVYSYLPLGVRVLRKIEGVIRDAMNALGGQEVFLPALQPKDVWDTTDRWKGLQDVMYQFRDHAGRDVGLAVTHEEVVATIIRQYVSSYADLPFALYQIQTKFRHEPRPKSGLLRAREFSMKDLYSCHATQGDCDLYYERVKKAYVVLFQRLGLTAHVVEATGGVFSDTFSHEFQVIAETGEDSIVLCKACGWAQNTEYAQGNAKQSCPLCKEDLHTLNAIEVGNIFKLGTRYSEPLRATYQDAAGRVHPIVMASYGLGVSRVLGTIVEVHHDERGIIWPEAVSPFTAHMVILGKDRSIFKRAEALYKKCEQANIGVLLDDRLRATPAEKLKDADLIGIPHRLVFSERQGERMEYCHRTKKTVRTIPATLTAVSNL